MMTARQAAAVAALAAVPLPNGKWRFRCPTGRHTNGDRRPSGLMDLNRNGWLDPRCMANHGCTTGEIAAAAGLRLSDLGPDSPDHRRRKTVQERKIVSQHDYQDADGNVRYQVVRWEPKAFQARRRVNKHWAWSLAAGRYRPGADGDYRPLPANAVAAPTDIELPEAELIPYRLLFAAACRSQPVIVVEGERKADAVAKLDLIATCNPFGAGKWLPQFGQHFRGRRLAILPDNDPPGQAHAMQVAGNLLYHGAAEVRIVHLPGLPEKGDVMDWLSDALPGMTPEKQKRALCDYIRAAPAYKADRVQPLAREVDAKKAA